jgi:hypothetical protein
MVLSENGIKRNVVTKNVEYIEYLREHIEGCFLQSYKIYTALRVHDERKEIAS